MPRTLKYKSIGIYLLLVFINAFAVCAFIALPTLKSSAENPFDNSELLDYGNSLSLSLEFFNDSVNDCNQLVGFSADADIKPDSELALLHCEGDLRGRRNLLGEDLLLHQSSSPTIGGDGRVYACIGSNAYAFNMDKTLAWTVGLNVSCEHLLSPAATNDGKVYVAANHRVIVISYSQELDVLSVWDLYNGTSLDGSMLGSKPITGLTLMGNGTSILINAGIAGLYAVAEDGSPLWSTSGDFNSKDATFPPGTFCSDQEKLCYFHFSPAVDQCDGSIYIVHTNGWLYAIDGWNPYLKWRYDIRSSGNTSIAGVTAGYNGRVYVATVTGVLFTFDTVTGHLLWQVIVGPLTNRTCFPKLDGKGQVVLGSLDGFLYVVSSNGRRVRKFLGSWAENSIIHSSPYIDCAKKEIFVAQVSVDMKMITKTAVTYLGAKGVTFFVLDAYTGYVLLSEYFPGISIANQDGMLDATLLLSVFATNYSLGGICDAFGAYAEGWKCMLLSSDALEGVPAYIGRSIEPLYIALPLTFFVLAILILIWFLLRKRYERNCRRSVQPEVFDRHGLPSFQDLCHKRAVFENKVLKLELLLKNNPDSKELQMELHKAVEDLYTNEWILSHFSRESRNDTGLEPLLREAALSSPDIEMFATSSHSSIVPRKRVSLSMNPSSFNKGSSPGKAKKIGYSQTSFNDSMEVEGLCPNRVSSRRSSANPLFMASESLGRLMLPDFFGKGSSPGKAKKIGFSQTPLNDSMEVEGLSPNRILSKRSSANPLFMASESRGRLLLPEFCTTHNSFYGASDLENGYSPCWNSTEMSLYKQQNVDSALESFRDGDAMATDTTSEEVQECDTSLYSSTTYATPSVNYDEYEKHMNTPRYNTSYRIGEITQDDTMDDGAYLSPQPLTEDLRSVIKDELQLGAAADQNLEQEDINNNADSLILKDEDKRSSVTLCSEIESKAPSGNEVIAFLGIPLDQKLSKQGDGQLPSGYPTESEDFGMVGVSEFDLPATRSELFDAKPDSSPLPPVDDSTVEEQELRNLHEVEETLHANGYNSFENIEIARYAGEEDAEDSMRDTQGMHLQEEHQGSSVENFYQPEDNSSSFGEITGLSSSNLVNENRNQGDVVAGGAQDFTLYSTPDKREIDSRVTESTANTSDASPDTSVSSRSESSNQSTPRSLVTTSVSEQAESLNSKASTFTDVSDEESSNNSDKSELEGVVTQHYKEMTTPSGSQRMTRVESNIADWHNVALPIEPSSSRPSQQVPATSATERQSSTALQGFALPRAYSASQPEELVRLQQFSVPRLSTAEMQSLDLRRSVLEGRTYSQGSFMTSGTNLRIPPGRASLSRWDNEEENVRRELS